jgi:hypothetical protein
MAGADTAAASTRGSSVNQQRVGQGEESVETLDDSGVITAIKGKKDVV